MSEEPSQEELAKIGLIALIDEATGYQNERFKDPLALRKMVKGYKHKKIKSIESINPKEG